MFGKCLFECQVADLVAVGVEVEQSLEPDAFLAADEGAGGCVGLYSATGAYPYQFHGYQVFLLGTGGKVDVFQRIELSDDDVDIVAAYAMGYGRKPLAFVGAGDGMKFTVLDITFLRVEMRRDEADAVGVSTHDNLVGQLVGGDVQMKGTVIGIDNQLGWCKCLHLFQRN